jgi:hypothetical protein
MAHSSLKEEETRGVNISSHLRHTKSYNGGILLPGKTCFPKTSMLLLPRHFGHLMDEKSEYIDSDIFRI